ncbi:MAG: ribonuclease P protein component [Eubacteriales bacterium]|nr:ribonuclease P protein component [Eubacteriales bacterium]
MQKDRRIRKNGHFNYVFRRGKRSSCATLVLSFVKAHKTQVGFSVSKKVGNAVTRNKVKRRLRECFRKKIPYVKNGYYVFSAKEKAAQADYEMLSRDVDYLLKRMNLIKSNDA